MNGGVLAGTLRIWMPVAVALVVLGGLVYAVVQHDLRSSADDPQVQMAEDAAASLNGGETPRSIAGGPTVDLGHSLAPFLVVYDTSGHPLAGTARLDGRVPAPPVGVLQSANGGENRVTWQPQTGLRFASVVVPWKHGYVLAGRSLREVEKRENDVQQLALLACLVGLVASALAALSAGVVTRRAR